jgi:hypothetical protein
MYHVIKALVEENWPFKAYHSLLQLNDLTKSAKRCPKRGDILFLGSLLCEIYELNNISFVKGKVRVVNPLSCVLP